MARAVDANGRGYVMQPDGSVQCDDSNVASQLPPPPVLPRLRAPPACGASHCIGIARDLAVVVSWATSPDGNRFGQLGCGTVDRRCNTYEMRSVALPTASGRIVAAAVGDAHSAFVSDQGELLVCGSDRWLQLGQDLLWAKGAVWQRSPQPVRKLLGTKVVGVACGADHTIALDEARTVWAFGRGEHGQLFGDARRPFTSAPAVSAPLTGKEPSASSVFARGNCSCVVGEAGELLKCIGRCEGLGLRRPSKK